ncbi:MAG: hypothetical protein JWP38_3761 [Herbaspirillum sp.]|nr:hypothetical protein [Herbaspirillum sp.]
MNLKLAIQIAIGLAGYCVWGAMAYVDPTQRPEFLKFNVLMCVGTIGLVLRDMQSPPPPPPPPAVVTNPVTQ